MSNKKCEFCKKEFTQKNREKYCSKNCENEFIKKQPKQYTVKVETLVPATFIFNVVAENVDDAIKQTSRRAPNNIQYSTARRKNLKATVCKQGTLNIVATKSFIK